MKRLDRATQIRDAILAAPADDWGWEEASGKRFRILRRPEWSAMLVTPFSQLEQRPEVADYQQAMILQASRAPLPYSLSVWVTGKGKVLSLEWSDSEARLVSMRPGAWQKDLFGVDC